MQKKIFSTEQGMFRATIYQSPENFTPIKLVTLVTFQRSVHYRLNTVHCTLIIHSRLSRASTSGHLARNSIGQAGSLYPSPRPTDRQEQTKWNVNFTRNISHQFWDGAVGNEHLLYMSYIINIQNTENTSGQFFLLFWPQGVVFILLLDRTKTKILSSDQCWIGIKSKWRELANVNNFLKITFYYFIHLLLMLFLLHVLMIVNS